MLPWQLLEAHDPGPVYFPAPSEALTRAISVPVGPCEKPSVEIMQDASIAMPRTRETHNRWEQSASGIFFISGLRGRDTLPRNQKKMGNKFEHLYYRLPSKSTKSGHLLLEESERAHGIHLRCGLALGDLLYDCMSSGTLSRVCFPRPASWTSHSREFDFDIR
jgi:hypothetical protein